MAGSNSSGQLKRPQFSIPIGSILGLISGTIIYIMTTFILASCHPNSQLKSSWTAIFRDSSVCGPIVFLGVVGSSIAKGVTGLGSGPMVLRAMAADNLIPKWIGEHSRKFGAVISALFCICISFNFVSSLSSMMFLVVFALLNGSLFMAIYSKTPSFRPRFKYFNHYISLLFSIICILSMLFINLWTALISIICAVAFYMHIKNKHLEANWGSLRDASAYNIGLRAALHLKHIHPHPKLYRPNGVIIINESISNHINSISFLDQMLKGKGMTMVARIFPEGTSYLEAQNDRKNSLIMDDKNNFNIFYQTTIAPSEIIGIVKTMLLSGIGSLRPNVIFKEFDEELKESSGDLISRILYHQWSFVLMRRIDIIEDTGIVDLWWLADDGNLALLIAQILSSTGCRRLRVLSFARIDQDETVEHNKLVIQGFLHRYRINAEVIVCPISKECPSSPESNAIWEESIGNIKEDPNFKQMTHNFMQISDKIHTYSSSSIISVVSLPIPPCDIKGDVYMRWLNLLSYGESPFLFVRGNGTPVISQNI